MLVRKARIPTCANVANHVVPGSRCSAETSKRRFAGNVGSTTEADSGAVRRLDRDTRHDPNPRSSRTDGDQARAALAAIAKLRPELERAHFDGQTIEVIVLQALALEKLGERQRRWPRCKGLSHGGARRLDSTVHRDADRKLLTGLARAPTTASSFGAR